MIHPDQMDHDADIGDGLAEPDRYPTPTPTPTTAENALRLLRAEVDERVEQMRSEYSDLLIAASLTWLVEERGSYIDPASHKASYD